MEAQKTMNSQSNSEQKVQCWTYHNFQLWTILQSQSNESSMVLTQKQTQRPTEQKTRRKFMLLQLTDFWQTSPKHMVEKRQSL
jgi:hypothetical protein